MCDSVKMLKADVSAKKVVKVSSKQEFQADCFSKKMAAAPAPKPCVNASSSSPVFPKYIYFPKYRPKPHVRRFQENLF